MDAITLHGMEFYAYHGVLAEEAKIGQKFVVDVTLFLPLDRAGTSDRLEDTVNYAEAYEVIRHIMTEDRFHLLEAAAEKMAACLLERFPSVERVRVMVRKVMPPIPGIFAGVSVEIERARHG